MSSAVAQLTFSWECTEVLLHESRLLGLDLKATVAACVSGVEACSKL